MGIVQRTDEYKSFINLPWAYFGFLKEENENEITTD